jgi:hypothetical protein
MRRTSLSESSNESKMTLPYERYKYMSTCIWLLAKNTANLKWNAAMNATGKG